MIIVDFHMVIFHHFPVVTDFHTSLQIFSSGDRLVMSGCRWRPLSQRVLDWSPFGAPGLKSKMSKVYKVFKVWKNVNTL
jgi:hypothetical protein